MDFTILAHGPEPLNKSKLLLYMKNSGEIWLKLAEGIQIKSHLIIWIHVNLKQRSKVIH